MSDLARALLASFDSADLDALADRLAPRIRARLEVPALPGTAWLVPDAAAEHLGVSRKRIYDLKSAGALEPDGYDGRTPLFLRETLDAYARSARG
jgi:hypothetical protein